MSPADLSAMALELRIVADLTGRQPDQATVAGHGAQEQPVTCDAGWGIGETEIGDLLEKIPGDGR